jgi:hypothetical protein
VRVKLFYITEDLDSDCYAHSTLSHETDWEEIPDNNYYELVEAIYHHNKTRKNGEKLIVLRQLEPEENKTLTPKLLASEFLKWKKGQEVKRKEQEELEKKKKEEAKKKRDLAKLEKLKKEYAEELKKGTIK